MLIIGHRGSAGTDPENTMDSFETAFNSGADMIELDVRLTKDGKLVCIHDARLFRTHHSKLNVSAITYKELNEASLDKPIPLATEVLDKYFGKILLNIALKSRGSGEVLIRLLKKKYITKVSEWDNILISSFKGAELVQIRRLSKHANLSLVHNQNPFIFVAYHRFIKLTAVGFHRLYLNHFAVQIANKAGIFTYAYTIDRTAAVLRLEAQGIEGVVTNYPEKFVEFLEKQSAK